MQILTVPGRLEAKEAPSCPCCGRTMEKNGKATIALRHLPWGWRGKDRGLAVKMGMQGVWEHPHGRGALQGPRPAHHAVAARIRV